MTTDGRVVGNEVQESKSSGSEHTENINDRDLIWLRATPMFGKVGDTRACTFAKRR
jgi:hypothetical protein